MAELEAAVRKMMDAFDRKDFDAITAMATDDAQAVDEISRRWIRSGKEARRVLRRGRTRDRADQLGTERPARAQLG
jgi:ketosteroid isomerase-like protein